MLRHAVLLGALLAFGCGPDRGFPTDTPEVDTGAADASATDMAVVTDTFEPRDIGPPIDTGVSNDMTIVYAHSDTVLYAIDPRTNAFSMVGTFAFPNDGLRHAMTDIAVDAMGQIVGTTADGLYRIDEHTAGCTLLASLPGMHTFVGLTYIPAGVLDPSNEVLVGGASDGSYWRIDSHSGVATMIGQFQGGWGLSGDIVSVTGAGTYATVRRIIRDGGTATDSLATIDPGTGIVNILGDTGFAQIFGLGYWRATLFGFTRSGQFLIIDAHTGHARLVSTPASQFSGAGVTTVAPIAPG